MCARPGPKTGEDKACEPRHEPGHDSGHGSEHDPGQDAERESGPGA